MNIQKENSMISPEAVESLRVELHVANEEIKREKELFVKEMNYLTESFKKSYDILQKKMHDTTKFSTELETNNKSLHDFNLKLKNQYQGNLKEISEEFHRKFAAHKDIMNLIVQEARKAKEEMTLYKKETKETQEEVYNRYLLALHKLEEIIQNTENSFHESI